MGSCTDIHSEIYNSCLSIVERLRYAIQYVKGLLPDIPPLPPWEPHLPPPLTKDPQPLDVNPFDVSMEQHPLLELLEAISASIAATPPKPRGRSAKQNQQPPRTPKKRRSKKAREDEHNNFREVSWELNNRPINCIKVGKDHYLCFTQYALYRKARSLGMRQVPIRVYDIPSAAGKEGKRAAAIIRATPSAFYDIRHSGLRPFLNPRVRRKLFHVLRTFDLLTLFFEDRTLVEIKEELQIVDSTTRSQKPVLHLRKLIATAESPKMRNKLPRVLPFAKQEDGATTHAEQQGRSDSHDCSSSTLVAATLNLAAPVLPIQSGQSS